MSNLDYKQYLEKLDREALIKECLKQRAYYNKSCRAWLQREKLRIQLMDMYTGIKTAAEDAYKDFNKTTNRIEMAYHELVQTLLDEEEVNELREKEKM